MQTRIITWVGQILNFPKSEITCEMPHWRRRRRFILGSKWNHQDGCNSQNRKCHKTYRWLYPNVRSLEKPLQLPNYRGRYICRKVLSPITWKKCPIVISFSHCCGINVCRLPAHVETYHRTWPKAAYFPRRHRAPPLDHQEWKVTLCPLCTPTHG